MFRIVYEKQAVRDIKNLKTAKLDKKAKDLVEIVRTNPYQNPPSYEKLVGNLSGFYSRRINIQHRFIYQVYEEKVIVDGTTYDGTVKIISMWSHYEDM
ncbi:Txe/YoeB family addiction module toxin [Lachnoclostridium edouardi]|uniref:Txe/YoeB family addiction module toxin n=1 Tax=Lachnoclostridium edouardi TaxID=1926283 RepID=UPI000C7B3249|nr:Txe/YoeB family addiction module toxin [Lachnoclostridium edouardi]